MDNIKMGLRKIGLEGLDWSHVVQDMDIWCALVYTVMNIGIPKKTGNFLTR
jgi:hypothetical protein